MTSILLAQRKSTVLWDGDVIVVGAGWAGVTAAWTAAQQGKKACLLEAGPALGFELSQWWMNHLPSGPVPDRIRELSAALGVQGNGLADLVAGPLAFDRLAEEAGLFSIVRVLPMRPLADARGVLAGVEVVGKSGRQMVRAPVVLDATPERRFSRRFMGQGIPAIRSVERRLYVYGVACPAGEQRISVPPELGLAGNAAMVLPTVWPREKIISFSVVVAPAATRADIYSKTLAAAAALIRHLRTTAPEFSAATLVGISPAGRELGAPEPWDDRALADTGLYPLPQAAAPEQELELAAQTTREAIAAGQRRKKLPRRDQAASAERIKTSELSTADRGLAGIRLPEVAAERHEPCEVLVAGCGPAGSLAALAAADRQARVTVLASDALYGGIATAGHIPIYYRGLAGGRQDGLDAQVAQVSSGLGSIGAGFHPMAKAYVLAEVLAEARVTVWAGHSVFGVVKSGHLVEGVLSADENGYHLFPCAVAIDATGDGDVAAAAGARFSLGRVGDGFPQPCSHTPAMIQGGKLAHRNFDSGWVDPTDTLDYSRAHFEGRRTIADQAPFAEAFHYCLLPAQHGVRESRLIRGRVVVRFEDFLRGRSYADTVCAVSAHYDNHAVDYAAESEWARRHVVMFGLWQHDCRGDIPYRALLPAGVEGLLVAGRAISVDHDAHQLVRMQRDMQKIGEACGLAAALAAKQRIMPSQVDLTELRRWLQECGVLPEQPPAPALKQRARALLACLGTDQNGLAMWRLRILSMRPKPPDWDAFFAGERDPFRRFCAAVTVAVAGLRNEAARQELVRALRAREEGPRLGRKSPARYVVAALALAEMQDPEMAGEIGRLLEDPAMDPPTLVLLIKALERTGPQGIRPIRSFLERNASQEFLFPLWGCNPAWKTSLRFMIELQAVSSLHVLGCREEDRRLQPYLSHPHLLIRRYALKLNAKE